MNETASDQCSCLHHEPSVLDRPLLFFPVIAVMFASCALFVILAKLPYGMQLATLIPYTALIFLSTFSAAHGQQPYFLECPAVSRELPRLAQRHGAFITAIVALETAALYVRPYLPLSWLIAKGKDPSPFILTLAILCFSIALVQILGNRSLLERSHSEPESEQS